jgi:hypothetical protein
MGAMDEHVTFGPTRFWPRFQAVLWTLETLLGVGAVAGGVWQLAEGRWPVGAGLVVMGAVLAPVGLSMAGLSWITARARGPVVEMTPLGFRDIRISADLIPWQGFRWDLCAAGRGRVSLQVGSAQPCRLRWPTRLQAPLNRLTGNPPWTVLTLGTGASAEDIAAQLRRFCP